MIYGYRRASEDTYHYLPKRVTTIEQADREIKQRFAGLDELVILYHISDLDKPVGIYPPSPALLDPDQS